MNKLTAEECRERIKYIRQMISDDTSKLSRGGQCQLQALEIALPVLEQQERGESLWEKMGMTDEDKYKIPTLPEEVTAQDMRETLNVLLHEEEAQAAASGFNQCLMECAPIYDAALRGHRRIDECLRELDGMQASWNAKHRSFVAQRNRAEAAERKLAELAPQPTTDTSRQIENDVWIEWGGGDNPAEGKLVQVEFRDGMVDDQHPSASYRWYHDPNNCDIIAYRVIENDGREG